MTLRVPLVQPGVSTQGGFVGSHSFISIPIGYVQPSGYVCTIILYPSPWYLSALFMSLFIFIIHEPLCKQDFVPLEGLENDCSSYKWPHSYVNVGVCAQQNIHYKACLLCIIHYSSISDASPFQARDFSDLSLSTNSEWSEGTTCEDPLQSQHSFMTTLNTTKSWSFAAISKYHPSVATVKILNKQKTGKKKYILKGTDSKYEREPTDTILLLTGAFGLPIHAYLLHWGKPKEAQGHILGKTHIDSEEHTLRSRHSDDVFKIEGLEPSLPTGHRDWRFCLHKCRVFCTSSVKFIGSALTSEHLYIKHLFRNANIGFQD